MMYADVHFIHIFCKPILEKYTLRTGYSTFSVFYVCLLHC